MRLHDELEWDGDDSMRPVLRHDGVSVASFQCVLPERTRVVTRLELLNGHRGIDVTVQPDTIGHVLSRLATTRNRNVEAWRRVVRRQLLESAKEWGIGAPESATQDLASTIASLGFPLVRSAGERGVRPPPYIPRWAQPVLSSGDARSAARLVFGGRATRRVARVLAESMLGSDDVDHGRELVLMPLAMAMALPGDTTGDLIANVLSAPVADHAAHHWPSVDQLNIARRGFALVGVDAAQRFALESLATLEGPAQLFELMAHMVDLTSQHLGPLPRRLAGLAEMVDRLERRPVALPQRRVAAHDAGAVINLPVQPLQAPREMIAVGQGEDFDYPDEVMRMNGATSGDHSLWLPRSRDELREWGVQLRNCMADYNEHVACNRSVIFGMRRNGRLVAGVELTRDLRSVRQFVRDDNQRPWRAEREALRDILRQLGVDGR